MATPEASVVPPVSYLATAYSLRGRTASGQIVSKGIIAADPRFLPLGSRVRLEAGAYSGEYVVADTGSMVRGRRIDIWTPTSREAMRFGKRLVKLTVLSLGGRRRAAPISAK
jgi:3D (Asp-Asp-Asp) domain-containing protein